MNDKPLVSIIIPTYNMSSFIKESIDSALAQTYENLEVIVINDGSTDQTEEVLKPYIEQNRIKYIYQETKGLAGARNAGLKISHGKYIAFLDADDVFLSEKINEQASTLEKNLDFGICYCDTLHFTDTTPRVFYHHRYFHPHGEIFTHLIKKQFINPLTILARRELFDKYGMFNEDLQRSEDWDMWLRWAKEGVKFHYLDRVLAYYRIGNARNLSAIESEPYMKEKNLEIFSRLLNKVSLKEKDQLKPSKILNRLKLKVVFAHLMVGDKKTALEKASDLRAYWKWLVTLVPRVIWQVVLSKVRKIKHRLLLKKIKLPARHTPTTKRRERVLVTGGAGFIGSHTADALSEKGYVVRILDNLKPPVHTGRWPRCVLGKGYELIKGDVREKKVWEKALKNVDYVFHLAAHQDQVPDFSKFFTTNTVSTALLYEVAAAKKIPIKKVVAASSQFVYGDGKYSCSHIEENFYPALRNLEQLKGKNWDISCPHGNPAAFNSFKENQTPNPTNSYGLSKVALENLALCLGKTYNVPTTILRYSIVQGPRQSPRNLYSGALRIFVTQALAGEPITVYEDGKQMRDFVNVEDVARANLLALENKKANFKIFNVGGGKGHSILDFARAVKRITKSPSEINMPGEFRRTDTRHAVSDIKKLVSLGWTPKHTPEKSIRDYVKWIKEEGFEKGAIKKQRQEMEKLGIVEK